MILHTKNIEIAIRSPSKRIPWFCIHLGIVSLKGQKQYVNGNSWSRRIQLYAPTSANSGLIRHTFPFPNLGSMGVSIHSWLVVWTPLKNMKVNWDDYSQYIWENAKLMFQTTNQIGVPLNHPIFPWDVPFEKHHPFLKVSPRAGSLHWSSRSPT